MPRTYIRKRPPKYTPEELEEAKKEIENGSSVYAAAKKFNIPYETLRRWHEHPPSHQGAGRGTVLSRQEEEYIVNALTYTAKCGYPMDRQDVKYMVKSYISSVGRKTPFKNDTPGYDFIVGFESRWKDELKKVKPDLLTKARAEGLTQFVVDEFFKIYQEVLDNNELNGHPERIFNLDETGLGTDPTKGKVFVPKSARVSYSRSGGAGKLQYSVLFVASADGKRYPPCVVFKGAGHLHDTWVQNGPTGALYGVSESGWMQDYIFENWLSAFAKQVAHITKPVLLLFDGHGSHLTYNVTTIAKDNGLILLCLPPNTSHALQPLDVGVFGPMKKAWKDILKTWYRESRLKNVDKAVFPSLLKKLMVNSFKPTHIESGFKGSGLYPVCKAAVANKIVDVSSIQNQSHLTEKELNKSTEDQSLLSPSTSSAISSTNFLDVAGPSYASISRPIEVRSPSPMKKLREAIINTLSPQQSLEVKAALKNSTAKRRRVQSSVGEVLTNEEVIKRLKEEEDVRNENKQKKGISKGKCVKGLKTKGQSAKNVSMKNKLERDFKQESEDMNTDIPQALQTKIIIGSWIAVNYQSDCGLYVKEYRGQVTAQDVRNKRRYSVKFLSKCKGEGQLYIFPEKDDIEWVDEGQISLFFDVPIYNGRYYKFEK